MREHAAPMGCAVVILLALAGSAAADTTGRYALEMSGERYGLVVLKPDATQLVVSVQDLPRPLVSLVTAFASGKPVKRDMRLASGAIIRRTNEARLLSAKESPTLPAGARIASFRIEVSGLKAFEAPKLDAITLTQRPDGTTVTGAIGFEAGAGAAPPFVTWQRSNGGHPAGRTVRIEYVGADGAAILELQLARCVPTAVVPQGANGTTRIAVTCGALRAG